MLNNFLDSDLDAISYNLNSASIGIGINIRAG